MLMTLLGLNLGMIVVLDDLLGFCFAIGFDLLVVLWLLAVCFCVV